MSCMSLMYLLGIIIEPPLKKAAIIPTVQPENLVGN